MADSVRVPTTIAPWLSVRNGVRAVDFYKCAFGASDVFRMDGDGSVVDRLSVQERNFWVGDESPEHATVSLQSLNRSTVRIILTVADPDAVFARALTAGATQIYGVTGEYGRRWAAS